MASNLKWNIILVGESGVGKTSLSARFAKNTFTRKYNPTTVVDRFCKKIKIHDNEIDLQIWGTSGKEYFKSLIVPYFQSAHGCILVYDVTKVSTFHQLSVWLSEFRSFNKTAPVIIVGNKNEDLATKLESLKLETDQEDIQFMECSAKSGENVNKVFESLIQKIWENTHPETLNNIDEMNSSVLRKPKNNYYANHEKYDKCKKFPTHCQNDEISDKSDKKSQEKSDKSVSEGGNNLTEETSELRKPNWSSGNKSSVSEKSKESNSLEYEKSTESRKPSTLNQNKSSIHQKQVNNFTVFEKSDKYVIVENENSSIQNSSSSNMFINVDENDSSFSEKSEEINSLKYESSGESRKPSMLTLNKSSLHQNLKDDKFETIEKSIELKSYVILNEKHGSTIHKKSDEKLHIHEKSDESVSEKGNNLIVKTCELRKPNWSNVNKSSILEKSKGNSFFKWEKSTESRKPSILNQNKSPIHQEQKNNFTDIDKFIEKIKSNLMQKDGFIVQNESEKNCSHEKVNDSLQIKPSEFKKSIMLNDRYASVPPKFESNFPTLKKYDKCAQQVMLKKENSYVHQKFNDYFPVMKNFGALTQSLILREINPAIHHKSDADKFWVDDKSGKPVKQFKINERNSSIHQKSEINNFCVDDKSGKPIQSLVIKERNSSSHEKSVANSFIVDDKLNKPKLSIMLNERNSSVQTLKFIVVMKLGSKKRKKIPVLKLS